MQLTNTTNADGTTDDRAFIEAAWRDFGGQARIEGTTELSAMVSTNRVHRVYLSDGRTLVAKVSSYGSYFLFSEDHDRIHRVHRLLHGSRYEHFLADCLTVEDLPYRYYDGTTWLVFYEEVPMGERLPKVLSHNDLRCLGREMALFHKTCSAISSMVPTTSTTIKSDAIHLLQNVEHADDARSLGLDGAAASLVHRHTHEFLLALEDVRYDYWPKMPIFIDWNLGNFSVQRTGQPIGPDLNGGEFTLFSRWDYDWFRVEVRHLDFYFLSRVSSQTGDRTRFSYGAHTLLEPGFVELLRSYVEVFPLTDRDLMFFKEAYRFFLLNYVIRDGGRFFRDEHCQDLQRDVIEHHLDSIDTLDLRPLVDAVL
jgi:hypothetical protein